MKTTSFLFSLLLIALAVKPFPVAAESSPDPVLDTEGKQLRSGVDYYILPVIRGEAVVSPWPALGTRTAHLMLSRNNMRYQTYDESSGQRFVTTGGVEGNPGRETLDNWFKIEKYEDDYKLVFCPTVCDFCKPVCGDIGIYIQNGYRRLALSDVPFKVMFKKA
ncbi:Kunitz trypsin inhibitor 2 [Vitis vinifera]|uniref:Kunitz trypsin inhibitor 2 n=1 Tax=Vitis vinifera TaxID=29760 RepID=A0A438FHE7_VITVI|nr:Kunitz trypsin inhibitor 2 [Vitis vinifera]